MQKNIFKHALVNSTLAVLYVCLISSFLFYVTPHFGNKPDTVFAPIIMLTLLVLSAALMAVLVFGRPVLWYLDGKKKEAVTLVFYTLGCIFAFFVIAFAGMIAFYM